MNLTDSEKDNRIVFLLLALKIYRHFLQSHMRRRVSQELEHPVPREYKWLSMAMTTDAQHPP